MNYCNIDLSQRNYKIKKDLSELNEKQQNLITLFFYIVRNFYPNVKFIDNCFVIGETTNSKTFLKKQEFINQFECYEEDLKRANGLRPWETKEKTNQNTFSNYDKIVEEKEI